MDKLIYPEDVDRAVNWPLGRALKLARRGLLPYYRLPDGDIRFNLDEVLELVRHVPAARPDSGKAVSS